MSDKNVITALSCLKPIDEVRKVANTWFSDVETLAKNYRKTDYVDWVVAVARLFVKSRNIRTRGLPGEIKQQFDLLEDIILTDYFMVLKGKYLLINVYQNPSVYWFTDQLTKNSKVAITASLRSCLVDIDGYYVFMDSMLYLEELLSDNATSQSCIIWLGVLKRDLGRDYLVSRSKSKLKYMLKSLREYLSDEVSEKPFFLVSDKVWKKFSDTDNNKVKILREEAKKLVSSYIGK